MKKRIVLTLIVAVLVFALMGCNVSSTSTTTETVTDANGNTTTTTTTTSTQNGQTTTTTTVEEGNVNDQIVATIAFQNDTTVDIYSLKFTSVKSDDWGEELLSEDNIPLEDGSTITYENAFKYTEDDVIWDLKIADENGNPLEFREIDITEAADPTSITIILAYDEAEDVFTYEVK